MLAKVKVLGMCKYKNAYAFEVYKVEEFNYYICRFVRELGFSEEDEMELDIL